MIKKFILSFLIVACFTVLLYTFILTPVNVSGASMLPTYHNNQKVWLYRLSQVKKGDVVIVRKDGETFIKRVVAGPGDELNILSDGTVIMNGEKLEETYVDELSREPLSISLPIRFRKTVTLSWVTIVSFLLIPDHSALCPVRIF